MAKRRGRPITNLLDQGTPELQRHRLRLVASDGAQSTCPLDVMLARKFISSDAYAAAVHFRACRAMVFGSPHLKAVDLNEKSGECFTGNTSEVETRYRAACAKLLAASRACLDTIENIVVHERWPRWLNGGASRWPERDLAAFWVLLEWHRARVT